MRIYRLDAGSGAKGTALAVAIVALGLVAVSLGLLLLVVLATAGAALGAGFVLYRRLTGRSGQQVRASSAAAGLDPALEVFARDPVVTDRAVGEQRNSLPPI